MQHEFAGKVVFVTGGSKGAGRGICERFLAHGATVVTCARSAPEQALPGAVFRQLDILDFQAVSEFFANFLRDFGRLDCLINNVGGAPPADAASASIRFSEKILALNLLAPIHLAQAAYQLMQRQADGGSIINIASVAALRPSPGVAVYGAAKAGLVHMTRSLAMEWAPRVRVNAIAAGLIHTEQAHLHYGDADGIAAVARTIPMGRLATPADIGEACLMLASPRSAYISGVCLPVDGGGETLAWKNASSIYTPT